MMGEEETFNWSITIKPSKAMVEGKGKPFEVTVEGNFKVQNRQINVNFEADLRAKEFLIVLREAQRFIGEFLAQATEKEEKPQSG